MGLCGSAAERKRDMPRELIDTGTVKRYVRRDDKGQFKESDDVGKSLRIRSAIQKRNRSVEKATRATAEVSCRPGSDT